MLLVRQILGDASCELYAERRVERLQVAAADASKPRLRGTTDGSTDVAIQLERGSFLRDGAVIHDDGERIVVVERSAENAMLIHLDPSLDRAETIRQALRIGHAFGNQHVPIEVDGGEIRVPVTTSEEILRDTVAQLGVADTQITFALTKLALAQPLGVTGQHHNNHE